MSTSRFAARVALLSIAPFFAATNVRAQQVIEDFESYAINSAASYLVANTTHWKTPPSGTPYFGLSTTAKVSTLNIGPGTHSLTIAGGGSGVMDYYVPNSSDTLTMSLLVRPSNDTMNVSQATVEFGLTTDGAASIQSCAKIDFYSFPADEVAQKISVSINGGGGGYITSVPALYPYATCGTFQITFTANLTTRTGYLSVFDVNQPGAGNAWTSAQATIPGSDPNRDFMIILSSGTSGSSGIAAAFDDIKYEGTAIPEPSTYAGLFGLAALGVAAVGRRRRCVV
ncbi:MAG: PEP-CTERM sorting domain-containing protein [Opitutaceae bacterium]|nr:PEP-CTERM sorting domain-containing protein [Opitutaceae bacterium]